MIGILLFYRIVIKDHSDKVTFQLRQNRVKEVAIRISEGRASICRETKWKSSEIGWHLTSSSNPKVASVVGAE